MTGWFWSVVICLVMAIGYCLWPLVSYHVREAWETVKHRRYMRRVIRDYQKRQPRQMSESWKRMKAYDREGDRVA